MYTAKEFLVKKITVIIIYLIVFSVFCTAQLKQDKVYHAGAGIVLSSSMYAFGSENITPIAPSLVAISGAYFKEVSDSMNGGRFSNQDFAFTAISGIVTNLALHYIFKKKKRKKRYDLVGNNFSTNVINK